MLLLNISVVTPSRVHLLVIFNDLGAHGTRRALAQRLARRVVRRRRARHRQRRATALVHQIGCGRDGAALAGGRQVASARERGGTVRPVPGLGNGLLVNRREIRGGAVTRGIAGVASRRRRIIGV